MTTAVLAFAALVVGLFVMTLLLALGASDQDDDVVLRDLYDLDAITFATCQAMIAAAVSELERERDGRRDH